jgi:hypothetical protein
MSLLQRLFSRKSISLEDALYADNFFRKRGLTLKQKREADFEVFTKQYEDGSLSDFLNHFNIGFTKSEVSKTVRILRGGLINGYGWLFGIKAPFASDNISQLMKIFCRFAIISFKYYELNLIEVPPYTKGVLVYHDSYAPNPMEFISHFTNKILPACPTVKLYYDSAANGDFIFLKRVYDHSKVANVKYF